MFKMNKKSQTINWMLRATHKQLNNRYATTEEFCQNQLTNLFTHTHTHTLCQTPNQTVTFSPRDKKSEYRQSHVLEGDELLLCISVSTKSLQLEGDKSSLFEIQPSNSISLFSPLVFSPVSSVVKDSLAPNEFNFKLIIRFISKNLII